MQTPRHCHYCFIIVIFNLSLLMLSFGSLSTMRRFNVALRSKSLSSTISNKYLSNNRKYFDVMLHQSVASRKSFYLNYSTATIGIVASSLLLAYSVSKSIEVSSCDELPINNDTTSTTTATTTATTTTTMPIDPLHDTAMYPRIEPYEKGMLKVSDIHSIAYSVYGNPDGKPVLFVHGGPGGGTSPAMARYFDPLVYKIVLVDQRGCGESLPFADLRENTTYDSVRDFEKIRVKLGIEKWQVFGGSWGSTLSLAYAMEHPNRVTELVLRGIFLVTEKELNWMYQGPGGSFMFPEDWASYEAAIPVEERGNYMEAYGKRLRGELGEEEMYKAAKAWSTWEGRISRLIQEPIENLKHSTDDQFALAFARIENHYFINKGFLPRDGFLLEKDQLDKIRHIPTFIVQGRYDVVCPPISAYLLHQSLPHSQLVYTLTGHSGMEKDIIHELVKATEMYKTL